MGGFSCEFNPKYFIDDVKGRTMEPNAHVPCTWTRRPKSCLKEVEEDYYPLEDVDEGRKCGFPDNQICDINGNILTPLRSLYHVHPKRRCIIVVSALDCQLQGMILSYTNVGINFFAAKS